MSRLTEVELLGLATSTTVGMGVARTKISGRVQVFRLRQCWEEKLLPFLLVNHLKSSKILATPRSARRGGLKILGFEPVNPPLATPLTVVFFWQLIPKTLGYSRVHCRLLFSFYFC